MVPACGVCYVMMEKNRKIAQERGLYDPKRSGGDKMSKLSDYQTAGDAIGLAKIGEETFTVVAISDSSYDGSPSIIITTKKPIEVEGVPFTKFYTSRKALLDTFKNEKLREDLKNGKPLGPVKCVLTKAKGGGKDYWVLEDA